MDGIFKVLILFLKIVIRESIVGSPIECKSLAVMLSIPEALDGCVSLLNCFERFVQSISIMGEHFGAVNSSAFGCGGVGRRSDIFLGNCSKVFI